MRKLTMTLSAAALMLGSMALQAGAHTQQSEVASVQARGQNATLIVKHISCGGPDLQCPAGFAKVCNPRNNKCCCAIPGQYR